MPLQARFKEVKSKKGQPLRHACSRRPLHIQVMLLQTAYVDAHCTQGRGEVT